MTLIEARRSAIHLLRAGQSVDAVAVELNKSARWVRKWRKRYETEGWDGLKDTLGVPINWRDRRTKRQSKKSEKLVANWKPKRLKGKA